MKNFRSKWTRLGHSFGSGFKGFLILLVGAYRTIGTTHLGGSCRFEPSCSQYAVDALAIHPPSKATRLIGQRILRCRPGGPFGYDPVPAPAEKKAKA